MNITVRKADLADALAVMDILSAAVRYKLNHDDASWGSEPFSEREVRGLIKTGSTYVVYSDKELVATFGLSWQDERIWGDMPLDAGYIHRLAIKDSKHGLGIGSQVLDWALEEVSKQGCRYLRLDCDSRNPQLCTYYEKHGFKQIGQRLIPSTEDYFANLYERPATPEV